MKRVKRQKVLAGLFSTTIAASAIVLLLASSIQARVSNNLSGRANITFVQSETNLQKRENLDQEYVLGWQEQFNRNLLGRTSLRYYNIGVTQSDGPNNWRSELQPTVEVFWRQQQFSVSGLGQYRETKSNDLTTELITELANVSFKTQLPNYPYLKLSYQFDRRYNRLNRDDRDTRDQSFDLDVGYNSLRFSSRYSFRRDVTDDWSRDLKSTTTRHNLQLQQFLIWGGGNARSSFSYRGDYRIQTDEDFAGGVIPRRIPVFAALAALDESPEIGALDTVAALADGDIASPTTPLINIGDGNTNWNIGADLGLGRDVDLLYIYTDSPSDDAVSWEIFTSEDAITWERQGVAQSYFSPGFSRYEISFDQLSTRYIKAVNRGFNLSDSVYVTEFQALVRIDESDKISLDNFVHEANINNSIRFSEDVSSTANITLRTEPGNELDPGRDEAYLNTSLRHQPAANFHHLVRGELALLNVEASEAEVDRSISGGYTAEYLPLPTLDLSGTVYTRINYVSSFLSEEFYNGIVRASADILPRLQVLQEGGINRANLNQSARQLDSWSYRADIIGSLTEWLEGRSGYGYRETIERDGTKSIRREYSLGFIYSITPSMLLRGNIIGIEDELVASLSQDFIFTWRLTPKVSASANAYLLRFDDDSRTERYGAQVEYNLSRRTIMTAGVQENDLTGTGGESTVSLRVGIRTGF